ncbi:MAG: hypothetical protein QG574_4210 [Cyanobacteriota bacterium erpe_2018_sw_21hr_WHONDRS-SW48-000092_B_bin.40]|jgi:hypothetical protein|nr:hypothetical protein [Cyanobacteriota bacterium erpe_2018_sw_21hr_WHONDRS-SW48-000092_B_bin.40]
MSHPPKFLEAVYQQVSGRTGETMRSTEEELAKTYSFLESRHSRWSFPSAKPKETHNMYLNTVIRSSKLKFYLLNSSIIRAINEGDFLTYGFAGRALIELTALLRYYLKEKLKPAFEKARATDFGDSEMNSLVEIEERLLRGGRFDWSKFFAKKFEELIVEAKQAKDKRGKTSDPLSLAQPEAINIKTVIERWSKEQPVVEVIYDMFCDMVHPNYGSMLCIATGTWDGAEFIIPKIQDYQDSTGLTVFNFTFNWLQSIGGHELNEVLKQLSELELDRPCPESS